MSENLATQIVHWPGKDTPACDKHAQKLISLGAFMGYIISSTPWIEDGTLCKNCENETKEKEVNQ